MNTLGQFIFIVVFTTFLWAHPTVSHADTPVSPNFDRTHYMAVSEVRTGMTGYGLSVFKGTTIERFNVEVLSVLHNFNPRHDVILVRLSGANLEHTGSIAGMSGSPVYLKDSQGKYRMVGAFAYGWSLMKDPIGGVQPIQYMLDIPGPSTRPAAGSSDSLDAPPAASGQITWTLDDAVFPPRFDGMQNGQPLPANDLKHADTRLGGLDEAHSQLRPLMTPLMTAGLSPQLLRRISPVFQQYGLMPMQAGSTSAPAPADDGQPPATLAPGSVLAVPLLTGDLDMTAIGTCTDVIDGRVLGFGHPFNNEGDITLPMGTGTINGIIASLTTSFKLGSLVAINGTLYRDQSVGIAGIIGKQPSMVPIDLTVELADGSSRPYHFEAAVHPQFTPTLTATAVAAAVTGIHDLPPDSSLSYDLTLSFANGRTLHVSNLVTDMPVQSLFMDVGLPIAVAIDNPFHRVAPTSVRGTVRIHSQSQQANILSVNVSKLKYRPGETVNGFVRYRPIRKAEATLPFSMKLPDDLEDGRYQLIVSGMENYMSNERQSRPYRFRAQNIDQLFNVLRDRSASRYDALYLRLSRKADGIAVGQVPLAHMPASRRRILAESRRGDITPFLDSDVKIMPTSLVMTGAAQFVLTVDRGVQVESAGSPGRSGDVDTSDDAVASPQPAMP